MDNLQPLSSGKRAYDLTGLLDALNNTTLAVISSKELVLFTNRAGVPEKGDPTEHLLLTTFLMALLYLSKGGGGDFDPLTVSRTIYITCTKGYRSVKGKFIFYLGGGATEHI